MALRFSRVIGIVLQKLGTTQLDIARVGMGALGTRGVADRRHGNLDTARRSGYAPGQGTPEELGCEERARDTSVNNVPCSVKMKLLR